jgi:hypothetical protein
MVVLIKTSLFERNSKQVSLIYSVISAENHSTLGVYDKLKLMMCEKRRTSVTFTSHNKGFVS